MQYIVVYVPLRVIYERVGCNFQNLLPRFKYLKYYEIRMQAFTFPFRIR